MLKIARVHEPLQHNTDLMMAMHVARQDRPRNRLVAIDEIENIAICDVLDAQIKQSRNENNGCEHGVCDGNAHNREHVRIFVLHVKIGKLLWRWQ